MELRTRRLMFTLGGSFLLSLGVLAACSDDSGFTALPGSGTAVDSGKKPTTTSDSGDDGNGDDQPSDGGTGADCAAAPKLRDSDNIFCHKGDDGGSLYCDPASTVCCDGAKKGSDYPPSTCAPATSSCTFPSGTDGGLTYACLQKSHCSDGACCLVKGPKGSPKPKADTTFGACGALYFSDSAGLFTSGTACKTACDTGEIELCASDDDCSGGKTCHYISANGHNTGACQ